MIWYLRMAVISVFYLAFISGWLVIMKIRYSRVKGIEQCERLALKVGSGRWLGVAALCLGLAACEMALDPPPESGEGAGDRPTSSRTLCGDIAVGERELVEVTIDGREELILCDNSIPDGPWILISTRHTRADILFDDGLCTDTSHNCSGHIPAALACEPERMTILLTTIDGDSWLNLWLPGEMLEFFTRARVLETGWACGEGQLCAQLDRPAEVRKSSSNLDPLFQQLEFGWLKAGGVALFSGGGNSEHHGVSFNFAPYGGHEGPLFISGADDAEGEFAVAGLPGALYFSCRP